MPQCAPPAAAAGSRSTGSRIAEIGSVRPDTAKLAAMFVIALHAQAP
jgi:hypothetical protein